MNLNHGSRTGVTPLKSPKPTVYVETLTVYAALFALVTELFMIDNVPHIQLLIVTGNTTQQCLKYL